MEIKLCGYLIGKDIYFDLINKRLFRITLTGSEKNIAFCIVNINSTMLHLLLYLLANARTDVVTKEELLEKIWEENYLTSSTQRLWQVLNGLKEKLQLMGLSEEFIKNIKGKGYVITSNEIFPLYYKDNEYNH